MNAVVACEHVRAIALNPKYPTAHHFYGYYLLAMGRKNEALAEWVRAQTLDPLSPRINADLGHGFLVTGQYDLAIEQLRKTLELEPNFPIVYSFLAYAYKGQGLLAEAVASAQQGVNWGGDDNLRFLGHFYGLTGKINEALELIERMRKADVPPSNIAEVYAGLGDKDATFEWLNRGLEEGVYDNLIWLVKGNEAFLFLRDDPRFHDLLRRMNLEP